MVIDKKKVGKLMRLTPPDLIRCQAEKPNGNSFMTLGGKPGWERCTAVSVWVATEIVPGKDGKKGSMSLCEECRQVMLKQLGSDFATFKLIPGNP